AGLSDGLEDFLLVRRVALGGRDEVGDQVVASTQLGVDVRPGVLDQVPLGDEPVVARYPPTDAQYDQGEHHDQPDAHETPPCSLGAYPGYREATTAGTCWTKPRA